MSVRRVAKMWLQDRARQLWRRGWQAAREEGVRFVMAAETAVAAVVVVVVVAAVVVAVVVAAVLVLLVVVVAAAVAVEVAALAPLWLPKDCAMCLVRHHRPPPRPQGMLGASHARQRYEPISAGLSCHRLAISWPAHTYEQKRDESRWYAFGLVNSILAHLAQRGSHAVIQVLLAALLRVQKFWPAFARQSGRIPLRHALPQRARQMPPRRRFRPLMVD